MEQHERPDSEPGVTAGPEGEGSVQPRLSAWLVRNAPLLVVVVAALYLLGSRLNLMAVALVAFGLGLVVFLHELGHFLVAKWCDVHVETFSIGFGPALPGCSFRWGETTYKVALFPLGGYVKMVGEGPDEEADDDPRAFKNKPVWQRVLIISAGVTMNVLLGCACFVVAYSHGVRQAPAVVGLVDAGSPAWELGVPTGAVIERIGKVEHPFFNDVRPEVMGSWKGQRLPLEYRVPGQPPVDTEIEPKRENNAMYPVIGVAPPLELTLPPPPDPPSVEPPVVPDSAAAHAEPSFRPGDAIVATTDSEHPEQVTPLPQDPRNPQRQSPDPFEYLRRMRLLAGRAVTLRVRRSGPSPGDSAQEVDIRVPVAYHCVLRGLHMRIGRVVAVRRGSPAERAGMARNDVIQAVDVLGSDGRTSVSFRFDEWVERLPWLPRSTQDVSRSAVDLLHLAAAQDLAGLFVARRPPYDPMRLPDALTDAMARVGPKGSVRLTVLRPNEARTTALSPVEWDGRWRFDLEVPSARSSPVPIGGLGVAYQVETVVAAVEKDSPAERAGLRKDDVIREYRLLADPRTGAEDPGRWGAWRPLYSSHEGWLARLSRRLWSHAAPEETYLPWWASTWTELQLSPYKEVQVRVKRDRAVPEEPITLGAEEDSSWPLEDRGLGMMPDWRLQKASGLGEALEMGSHATLNFIQQVYGSIMSILTGRVSPELLSGPLVIAKSAYAIAGSDFYLFVLFLGIISVNLAVINFLPIPVLDGGHIVFLLYEKLRGRPAPERMREVATYVGVGLILCLMVFVIYQDVKKM